MTEAATIKTVEHGEASELPEITWGWRRLFVFGLTLILCALVAWIAWRVSDVRTLREIAVNSQGLIFLLVFVYVAGATATDVVQLVTAFGSTRKETVTSAPPPATIVTPDATASTGAAASAAPTVPDQPSWAAPK